MKEKWRLVEEFPAYEVSSAGRVRRVVGGRGSRAGYVLRQPKSHGRPVVVLYSGCGQRRTVRVSRLVAIAFLGPPAQSYLVVCHNDGNCSNNIESNLRWDTQAGNLADMEKHGTKPNRRGEAAGRRAKISQAQANIISSSTLSTKVLGAQFGIHHSQVSRIKTGKAW